MADYEQLVFEGLDVVAQYNRANHNRIQIALDGGAFLNRVRAQLDHGQWLPYLEGIGLKERTARRWMRLAAVGFKSATVADLGGIRAADESLSNSNTPHLGQGTSQEGWHTPEAEIELVHAVMGGIDLDPASNPDAQERVQAAKFFTKEDDGLAQPWEGRVYVNPPYTGGEVDKFADKLVSEFDSGNVSEAIWLSNNSADTEWFYRLTSVAAAVLFIQGRVKFWTREEDGTEKIGAPLQGQVLVYLGDDPTAFIRECKARDCGRGYLSVPAQYEVGSNA